MHTSSFLSSFATSADIRERLTARHSQPVNWDLNTAFAIAVKEIDSALNTALLTIANKEFDADPGLRALVIGWLNTRDVFEGRPQVRMFEELKHITQGRSYAAFRPDGEDSSMWAPTLAIGMLDRNLDAFRSALMDHPLVNSAHTGVSISNDVIHHLEKMKLLPDNDTTIEIMTKWMVNHYLTMGNWVQSRMNTETLVTAVRYWSKQLSQAAAFDDFDMLEQISEYFLRLDKELMRHPDGIETVKLETVVKDIFPPPPAIESVSTPIAPPPMAL